ncbi:MAG: hypothetical protein NVSMB9_09170 [Isosphaeraceae bacterium]
MTPHETNGQAPSFDPSVLLQEMVEDRPLPDDQDAPFDEDSRAPWPDDADGPRFTFAELIDQESLGYRAWGTNVGDFLAREMEKLAQLVRWTQATTPEEHEARMEVWDDEIRQRYEAIGYQEGRYAGCRCGECPME